MLEQGLLTPPLSRAGVRRESNRFIKRWSFNAAHVSKEPFEDPGENTYVYTDTNIYIYINIYINNNIYI